MSLALNDNLLKTLREAEVALFHKNLEGRYHYINGAGARLIGRDVGDIVGKTDGEIFTPRTAAIIGVRDKHIAGLREPFAYTARSVLLGTNEALGFYSVKWPVRETSGPTGLVCLSLLTDREPKCLDRVQSLVRALVQFRPERLLEICRGGARLRLV